jgi:L-asparaginase
MSGTGNGDSFLRTNAARSAAARSRYGRRRTPLATAVTAIAGPGGELQQSAGGRFGSTGEGEGGLIGIEASSDGSSNVVFDFNCGGMWRAYYELADGKEKPKVMVFRDEYRQPLAATPFDIDSGRHSFLRN